MLSNILLLLTVLSITITPKFLVRLLKISKNKLKVENISTYKSYI
jgi:hypothetical protein